MAPQKDHVIFRASLPVKRAFSGWGFFEPTERREEFSTQFRSAFSEPGNKASCAWDTQFDNLVRAAYDETHGVSGSIGKNIIGGLDKWGGIWDSGEYDSIVPSHLALLGFLRLRSLTDDAVDRLKQKLLGTDYDVPTTGNSAGLQDALLQLYVEGVGLSDKVAVQIASMETDGNSYQAGINLLSSSVEPLKASWVDFAKKCAEGNSFASDQDRWFRHLQKWSDAIDKADCSLPLCQTTLDRFNDLRVHMGQLTALLGMLPALCFDMIGNLISGAPSEARVNHGSLHALGERLGGWMDTCPFWTGDDFSAAPKVKHGEILYSSDGSRQCFFDDPNSVNVSDEGDVQVGISRFDYGTCNKTGRVATRLNVGDPHKANRVWEARGGSDRVEFFSTKSSWIEVPSRLRDHVLFSWTLLDDENNKGGRYIKRVASPGMEDQNNCIGFSRLSNDHFGSFWRVKFPRAFASDDVVVVAWFMDFDVKFGYSFIGHKVTVDEVSREGFRVLAEVAGGLDYSRIGYVAYERGKADGIHTATYHLDVPRRELVMNQNHNWSPCFIPFPKDKFRRRPAVANMISFWWCNAVWNYRADYRHAVTRDGILIQGYSWANTILCDLRYEIIALSND
jgi:hypothetical protein